MNQCFAIPLTLIKVVVKYAGNFDFTFDACQRDEVKSVVAMTTPLILVKNEDKYDRYTFTTLLNGAERWEQICNELRLQTLMSKLILRTEIKKLHFNTVLKIFIRYRTRAGNHCYCCFIIIFENFLEYVVFRSHFFLSYLEWIIFSFLIDQYTM